MGISVSESSKTHVINLERFRLAILPPNSHIPVKIEELIRQLEPQHPPKNNSIEIRPSFTENAPLSPKREEKEGQFAIEQIDLNSRLFKLGNEKTKATLKQSDSRRNMNPVEPLCLSRLSGDVQNESMASIRAKKVKIVR